MKGITAALLLLLSGAPAMAADEIIGVRVREWFARMSGAIEADDGSGTSTRLDLASDLGLADRNLTHEIQGYLGIPLLGRIYLGWWRAHDTGSETLDRTIEFEGFTYTASTRIDSEVTLDVAYLTYEFAFPTIPVGDIVSIELGAQVSLRGLRGEGTIDESAGGNHASDDGIVGLPTIGAHVTVQLFKLIRVEVEAAGLTFRYGDWSMHYWEVSAEVVAQPLPWLFAGVGYKLAEIHVENDGNQRFLVDVGVAGLYITAGVRF
jgi:hypothetical protein